MSDAPEMNTAQAQHLAQQMGNALKVFRHADDLFAKLMGAEGHLSEIQTQVTKAEAELASLRVEKEELERTHRADMQQMKQEKLHAVAKRTAAIQEFENEKLRIKAETDILIAGERQRYDAAVANFHSEIAKMEDEKKGLQQKIAAAQAQWDELRRKISEP